MLSHSDQNTFPVTYNKCYILWQVNHTSLFPGVFINPRTMKSETSHYYYIAAEEINWDYGIRKPQQLISQT